MFFKLAIFLLLRCQPSARAGQSHDNSRRVSHRSQFGAVRREQSASVPHTARRRSRCRRRRRFVQAWT